MKNFLRLRLLALAGAGLLAAGPRVGAQGFGLSVSPSATSMLVSNSLTYTINVTNLTQIPLADAVVTNLLPSSVLPLSATNSQGSVTNYGSVVVFDLGPFSYPGVAQLSLTVEPTVAGLITNTVTVASTGVTNASTNVVVLVTNAVPVLADLGVAVAGPVQPVVTNDWMTYGVIATNFGPDAATGVALTNTLPPGAILRGAIPANYTIASSNLIFNLGALAAGAGTNFQFTIEPTNAGRLTLSASIGSGVQDTNLANNFASTNVTVTNYLAGQLLAFTNSPQSYNPQNGLIEQSITLSNAGPASVASARVVVTGLTNQLANAVGTNAGSPFVVLGSTLNSSRTVSLLLQYYLPTRSPFPFSNSQLHAFEVPLTVFAAPTASAMSTNLDITRIVKLPNGNMLIEWPAITNRTYTVVYSDKVSFSNAVIAPPSITALGTRLQWVDYGPPTTVSAPTNSSRRFYRVFLNP
jgi:uncharacterized repeat protein (TIGR01451 family)